MDTTLIKGEGMSSRKSIEEFVGGMTCDQKRMKVAAAARMLATDGSVTGGCGLGCGQDFHENHSNITVALRVSSISFVRSRDRFEGDNSLEPPFNRDELVSLRRSQRRAQ